MVAMLVLFSMGMEYKQVDEQPSSYSELSVDWQRRLMPGSEKIYRATFHNMQTSEQYVRFELQPGSMCELEDWLFSYMPAEDVKRLSCLGFPDGMSVRVPMEQPLWWQVPAGVHGVYYEFFSPANKRKYVQAFVVPATGQVWVKWTRI